MKAININSNLTAFYFGADSEPSHSTLNSGSENDWVYGACHSLGVASYAIYSKGSAVVFDTLCSPEQANEIKNYLETQREVTKFTVINSHWHLHHIGGNELYKNFNVIATRKTRLELAEQKEAIESGISSWGPPPIERVRLPDIVFDHELAIFLDNLEVRLYAINIHSADSLCAYIPRYKILLASDMVEDTIPFITDPQAISVHLQNYAQLREMDIEKILPNHCRLKALESGGYSKEIIESSAYYLNKLHKLLTADPVAELPDLQAFMSKYLDAGTISYWPAYERVHNTNIQKVKSFLNAALK